MRWPAAAAVTLALCALLGAARPASAAERQVAVDELAYNNDTACGGIGGNLTIADPGDTVRWTFCDPGHTVIADSGAFKSGDTAMAAGQQYAHTFTTPGDYAYHCMFHSQMTGTVLVRQTGPTTTTPAPTTAAPTTAPPQPATTAPPQPATTATTQPTTTTAPEATTTTLLPAPSTTRPGATTSAPGAPTTAPADDSELDGDGGGDDPPWGLFAVLVGAVLFVGASAAAWRRGRTR